MKLKDIAYQRLNNQSVAGQTSTDATEVVRHLVAVQAQDYLGSLWAVGLRIKNATEPDIENALNNRQIVRTWPMRGTLHFVAAEDARWMLPLLTPRVIVRTATIYKQAGLDNKIFLKAKKIIVKALEQRKVLTRTELYDVLEDARIDTADQRGLHILGYLAQEGLICFGGRKGKQQTFVLLDEWLPKSHSLTREESLYQLAKRYFASHGPATRNDFAWWSGLGPGDVNSALAMIKTEVTVFALEKREFWTIGDQQPIKSERGIYLLPAYDEYTVAYKDRSAILDPAHVQKARNGIFGPVVIVNSQIAGTWSRTITNDKVSIQIKSFIKLQSVQAGRLQKKVKEYCRFIGKSLANLSINH